MQGSQTIAKDIVSSHNSGGQSQWRIEDDSMSYQSDQEINNNELMPKVGQLKGDGFTAASAKSKSLNVSNASANILKEIPLSPSARKSLIPTIK